MAEAVSAEDERRLAAGESRAELEARPSVPDYRAIPCTGCEYCVGGCPMSIPIPKLFSLYNASVQSGDTDFGGYAAACESNGQASDCIGCGQCEGICPQKLPIIENLQKIAEKFE